MKFIYRLTSTEIFFQYEACLFDLFIFLELLLLFQVDRETHEIFAALRVAFLMPQVCFKPVTCEMHHVRAFFLCGVMTFFVLRDVHSQCVYLQEESLPWFLSAIELSAWPLFIS